MAPEVIDNKEYSLKADVYSYGVSKIRVILDHYLGNLLPPYSL